MSLSPAARKALVQRLADARSQNKTPSDPTVKDPKIPNEPTGGEGMEMGGAAAKPQGAGAVITISAGPHKNPGGMPDSMMPPKPGTTGAADEAIKGVILKWITSHGGKDPGPKATVEDLRQLASTMKMHGENS